jgi:hypothetical protein
LITQDGGAKRLGGIIFQCRLTGWGMCNSTDFLHDQSDNEMENFQKVDEPSKKRSSALLQCHKICLQLLAPVLAFFPSSVDAQRERARRDRKRVS